MGNLAWGLPANITQDHGPRHLRPHPTQKPESTAQSPCPSPKQLWAALPRRWEAEPMAGGAVWAVFTCGLLWGAVSCWPGRLGWPGSPGASSPAVPGLVPSESGCQSSLGQPDGSGQEGHGLCAHCPPGRAGRTSLRPVNARGCHLLSHLGEGGDCAPRDSMGTGPSWSEEAPRGPGPGPPPANTPGVRSTPCQYRGTAGGQKRSHHVASWGEVWWGWGLVLWGSPAPAGASGWDAPARAEMLRRLTRLQSLQPARPTDGPGAPKGYLRWT